MDYEYKDYIVFKYLQDGVRVRWGASLNGDDVVLDQSHRWMVLAYIDSGVGI